MGCGGDEVTLISRSMKIDRILFGRQIKLGDILYENETEKRIG